MRIGCFTITFDGLKSPGLEAIIRKEFLITYEAWHYDVQCVCFIGTYPGFADVKGCNIPIYDVRFRYTGTGEGIIWEDIGIIPRKDVGDYLPPMLMEKPHRERARSR